MTRSSVTSSLLRFIPVLCMLVVPRPDALAQGDSCPQPAPVCDARDAVFAVSAFDPVGSAVRIGPERLVTARHIVADRKTATLFLPDGRPIDLAERGAYSPTMASHLKLN